MVGTSINFNNVNQSSIVKDAIPLKFHDQYQLAAAALLFISLLSFVASFYEIPVLFTITNLLCTIVIVGLVLISIGNQVTSNEIADKLDNKCVFVLPQFSQDLLMSYGCSAKYKTFEQDTETLACPKIEQTRVWEDNVDLLIDDQRQTYGCLNTDCCE